jgi:hypothetical protein
MIMLTALPFAHISITLNQKAQRRRQRQKIISG